MLTTIDGGMEDLDDPKPLTKTCRRIYDFASISARYNSQYESFLSA
jgi:hypothetical protein